MKEEKSKMKLLHDWDMPLFYLKGSTHPSHNPLLLCRVPISEGCDIPEQSANIRQRLLNCILNVFSLVITHVMDPSQSWLCHGWPWRKEKIFGIFWWNLWHVRVDENKCVMGFNGINNGEFADSRKREPAPLSFSFYKPFVYCLHCKLTAGLNTAPWCRKIVLVEGPRSFFRSEYELNVNLSQLISFLA